MCDCTESKLCASHQQMFDRLWKEFGDDLYKKLKDMRK